jgi:hypothetical protein
MVLAINPATIVFPAFIGNEGSREPLYAQLTGTKSASVNITSIKSANKLLNVEINKDGFDGDPARQIRFNVLPGMAVGRFREAVVFKTDNKSVASLKLYVVGEVLGTISVSPRHLPLGMISPGSTTSKTIVLKSTHDASTFNILDVSSTVKEIVTELITVTEGKEYQVVVSLPDGTPHPIVRGEIIIKTDDKEQESITVRVFGRTAPVPRRTGPKEPDTGKELPPM